MRRMLIFVWTMGLICLPLTSGGAESITLPDEAVAIEATAAPEGDESPAENAQGPAEKSPKEEKTGETVKEGKEEAQANKAAVAKADKDSPEDKPEAKKAAKPAKVAEAKESSTKEGVKAKKPETKKATVVRFTLSGSYPEGPEMGGLFGELQQSLSTFVRRLDDAAKDKDVAAVWLRFEDVGIGRGKVSELRQAIGRLRKAGKPVYAEVTTTDSAQYLVASACDAIIMPPSGVLMLPGVRAEITFYKGLLDKLGIQFEALQMGKYKGAAEPMTRTKMSPPLRESMEALVDDTYEYMTSAIGDDRGLKDYEVKTLLDKGLFTAQAAKQSKLIDQILYTDQFEDMLKKKLKVDEIRLVTNYKKEKVEVDLSGIGGMMKLLELMMGGKPGKTTASKHRKIAVVYAVGPIMEGKSESDLLGVSSVGSTTIVKALRDAAEDSSVVAVVLRIDSPGGSATASDLIWRETVRMKKPLLASMGDVAGSGGYYIAMGAQKIYAAPSTITGSIGVIGGKLVLGGLYEKIGVSTDIVSRGKMSGALTSTKPFTPEEREAWQVLLKDIYHQFVSKAAQGRKMSFDDLEKHAQGRVYTGRMAKKIGLIDELGTLHDAIAAAKKAAGLKPEEEVELLILPKPKTFLEQLFGDPSVATDLESAMPELLKPLSEAKLWRRLFAQPTLLWMPYAVQLK